MSPEIFLAPALAYVAVMLLRLTFSIQDDYRREPSRPTSLYVLWVIAETLGWACVVILIFHSWRVWFSA